MTDSTTKLLLLWLRHANHFIDEHYFRQQFLSHPDAPGVSAITDTLNELSIENLAVEIPFSELAKLEEPFMAYIKQDREEQFALVHKRSENTWQIRLNADGQTIIPAQKFEELFTGLAVLIDKAPEKNFRAVRSLLKAEIIVPAIVIIGFISLYILHAVPVLHFAFSVAGLLVSMLIAAKELGLNTGKLE
ncbi:MAG TPA: cysteine peptidase family C39 domain-containing protein, partial [Chitinophagaceae bacterium]|nr:cysteine peptidase family C39 domain-containing protein [Chitinophagaceae bacterium]